MIKRPKLLDLREIIAEESKLYLFEIFDKSIPTSYTIGKDLKYFDFVFDVYKFKTTSGNFYDVDFYKTIINLNVLKNVQKYLNSDKDEIKTIDIGFTSSNVDREEKEELHGTSDDPYVKRTNRNEQYEVLGKVAYLVEEYVKNNDYNVYVVGKSDDNKKMTVYLKMFENIFRNNFTMIEDVSKYYDNGAYYFIRK